MQLSLTVLKECFKFRRCRLANDTFKHGRLDKVDLKLHGNQDGWWWCCRRRVVAVDVSQILLVFLVTATVARITIIGFDKNTIHHVETIRHGYIPHVRACFNYQTIVAVTAIRLFLASSSLWWCQDACNGQCDFDSQHYYNYYCYNCCHLLMSISIPFLAIRNHHVHASTWQWNNPLGP